MWEFFDPISGTTKATFRSKLAGDHLLPKNAIKELVDTFGTGLTKAQREALKKELYKDADNLRPLLKRLNSSKRDQLAGEFRKALGDEVDPKYTKWLQEKQAEMVRKVLGRINDLMEGQ